MIAIESWWGGSKNRTLRFITASQPLYSIWMEQQTDGDGEQSTPLTLRSHHLVDIIIISAVRSERRDLATIIAIPARRDPLNDLDLSVDTILNKP